VTLHVHATGTALEAWRIERNGVHVGDVRLEIHATGRGTTRVVQWDRADLKALSAHLVREGTFTFRRWDDAEASKVLGAALRDAFTEEMHVMTDNTIDRLAADHDARTLGLAFAARLTLDGKGDAAEVIKAMVEGPLSMRTGETPVGVIVGGPGNPHKEGLIDPTPGSGH
jgi:hypothetical protein